MGDVEIIDLSSDDDSDKETVSRPTIVQHTSSVSPRKKRRSPSVEASTSGSSPATNGQPQNTDNHERTKNQEALRMLISSISSIGAKDVSTPVIIKRLEKKFGKCSQDFLESEECYECISHYNVKIQEDSKHMFAHVRDFSNVLSSYQLWQKKMPPADADGSPKRAKLTEKQLKWKKSLKMLYSTLRKCQKKIKELDETEVDWDDEKNSAFMKKRKFEERAVELYSKIIVYEKKLNKFECEQLTAQHPKICTLGHTELEHKHINAAVDKFVNRGLKSGEISFPNFRDIKCLVSSVNSQENLQMSADDVTNYARKAFVTVGKKIKEYREREFQRNVLETELEDPADNDPELMRKLQENKKISEKKVSEIFNKYAKESEEKETEETLGSDDEVQEEADNPEAPEPGDEEDYELRSVHGDDEVNEEDADDKVLEYLDEPDEPMSVSSAATKEDDASNHHEDPTNGKTPAPETGDVPTEEFPEEEPSEAVLPKSPAVQAVLASSPEKKSQKRKYTVSEEDLINDIGMLSDVDCQLVNSNSDEERELLKTDDEMEEDYLSKNESNEKNCYQGAHCPLKKAKLETAPQTDEKGESKSAINDIQDSGSFNPVIVAVQAEVSGFSQEISPSNSQVSIGTAVQTPPAALGKPLVAQDAELNNGSRVSSSAISSSSVVMRQKARKSFPRPPIKLKNIDDDDDCVTLD